MYRFETHTQLLLKLATLTEQDAWTDKALTFVGGLAWTPEDAQNVLAHRELFAEGDATVGYVIH